MKGQADLITCGDNGDSVVQADFRLILISMNTHKKQTGSPRSAVIFAVYAG